MAVFESDLVRRAMAPMRETQRREREHVRSPIPESHCDSAQEFWDMLTPKRDDTNIYRGHADAEWKLTPKARRRYGDKKSFVGTYVAEPLLTVEHQIVQEALLLKEFAMHCDTTNLPILDDSLERRDRTLNRKGLGTDFFQLNPAEWPNNDWLALMALGQHHGLPTRLLDWSRRAHVAAYFAASDTLKNRKDWRPDSRLAVWALNAETVEERTTRPRGPIFPVDPETRRSPYPHVEYIPDIRVVTVPGATSAHLSAQSGLFTLQKEIGGRHDMLKEPCLEDDMESGAILKKFTLPVAEASKLLELCKTHHITAATLYRSYTGAAEAVLDDARIWSEVPVGTDPSTGAVTKYRVSVAKIALIGPSGSGAIRQLEIRYGNSLNRNMDEALDTATPQTARIMLDWMRHAPPGFVSVSVHEAAIREIAKIKRETPDMLRDIFFIYLATDTEVLRRRLAEQGIPNQMPGDELLAAFKQIADMTIDTSHFEPEATRSNIDAALVQAGVRPV